jgi:signal transduction histidine kinase
MRRRALKAGVGLAIDSSAGGTCIELQLPTCEQVSGS